MPATATMLANFMDCGAGPPTGCLTPCGVRPYVASMVYPDCITIDPQIRSGKPCVNGTRIAVADVLDYLGGGMTVAEILADFPDLTAETIQACLTFAAGRERRLLVAT